MNARSCQLDDDLFDFGGDDVAAGEFGVVENLAEDAFGEQVLDEHALDRIFGEIGIDGLTAQGVKVVEAANEGGTAAALLVDDLLDGGCEFGDALLEFGDGGVPLLVIGLAIGEKAVQQLDQVLGGRDVFIQAEADAVLVKDGALGHLKDGVGSGIAALELRS